MTESTTRTRETQPIDPGATLGVLGGGQLGRMFALAAARIGYRVHVFSPESEGPATVVADCHTVADYDDLDAVAQFARSVDVVTLEFENVSVAATDAANQFAPVRPAGRVLHTTQDRLREKRFLVSAGIACTPFAEVASAEQLSAAIETIGTPAVLKTTAWGYDGKGQAKIAAPDQADDAWATLDRQQAICEGWVDYDQELSVLVARSTTGEIAFYGPIANFHENHILDLSVCPWPQLDFVADEACKIARTIAEQLDAVGLLCVEFFLTTDGRLLVNEIAPRPHNSGHLTIDACPTSQFEQQVRAICGLPLGATKPSTPAAMANLLGQLWIPAPPPWAAVLADPKIRLHLYGKSEARTDRKMGHLTVLADSPEEAIHQAQLARKRLASQECRSTST